VLLSQLNIRYFDIFASLFTEGGAFYPLAAQQKTSFVLKHFMPQKMEVRICI